MKEGLIYVDAWTMAGQDPIRANSQPIGSSIVIAEDIIFFANMSILDDRSSLLNKMIDVPAFSIEVGKKFHGKICGNLISICQQRWP